LQQMAHFMLFSLQIAARNFGDARLAGNELRYLDSCGFELANLVGIVGKQANAPGAELLQDLGGEFVLARVGGKTKRFVSLDGVHATILKLVGAQLVHQADAAALLRKIEENSGGSLGDFLERKLELCATVATQRCEHVAGKALRVDANQRRFAAAQIPADERDGLILWAFAFETVDREWAIAGWKDCLRNLLHRLLVRSPGLSCG
jgi:hypothetical protein